MCDYCNKLLHCNSGFTAHVVTTTRVSPGRELVASYIGPGDEMLMEREERVGNILSRWRFVCGCPVCSLSGEELAENDRIRRDVAEHSQAGVDRLTDRVGAEKSYGICRLHL